MADETEPSAKRQRTTAEEPEDSSTNRHEEEQPCTAPNEAEDSSDADSSDARDSIEGREQLLQAIGSCLDGGNSPGGSSSEDDEDDATITLGGDDASAVVIWMHGLGDTPHGWADFAVKLQRSQNHTRWILPCAPRQSVTCNNGMVMTSWMDLHRIPIAPNMHDDGTHLPASIEMIHRLVDEQISAGVPANRVVLGGFSQGGALALVAALSYRQPLGGACILSGWCPPKSDVVSLAASSPSKMGPFIVCHGTADATVLPACGEEVHRILKGLGASVEFHAYAGVQHGSCREEEEHISSFLKRVLP